MASLASHKTAEIIFSHFSRSQLAELHGHLLLMTPQITAMNFSSRDANNFLKQALKEFGLPNEAIYAKMCKRVPPAHLTQNMMKKDLAGFSNHRRVKLWFLFASAQRNREGQEKVDEFSLKFRHLFLLLWLMVD